LTTKAREIVREIGDMRDNSTWSKSQLQEIDAKTQVLSELAPEASETERRKTTRAFATFLDGLIHNPEPIGPQLARIEAHLGDLKARDASLIGPLEKALGDRISRPEPAFVVDADRSPESFARAADLFEPDAVRVADKTLAREADGSAGSTLLTRVVCRGDVEFLAEFDVSWLDAPAVGLALDADDRHRYLFLIGDPPPAKDPPPRGGSRKVWIFRDNTALARGTVAIPAGPLRVEARRQGARLALRVAGNNVLDFVDPFPLAIRDTGRFGVYWPPGVRLARLSGLRQARPSDPSPMERGDDLFRAEKYDQAVEFYRDQVIRSGAETEVGREARFKQALSLAGMHDEAGAIAILGGLAGDAPLNGSSAWPPRAAAQLAIFYLQRKDWRAANEILETLAAGENADRLLITLMPAESRDTILGYYASSFGDWHNAIWYQQKTAERRSRALAIHKLLGSDPATIRSVQWGVIDDLRIAGDRVGALRGIEGLLSEPDLTPPERIAYLRDLTWLSIEGGDARLALEQLNRLLAPGERRGEFLPLLVERARALAALGRWEEAERDSEAYIAEVDRSKIAYAEFADASLVRGTIRDHRGDRAGASAAWREGLLRNWIGVAPPSPIAGVILRNRTNSYAFSFMLMSLTGEVTEDEALGMFKEMVLANQSGEKVVVIASIAINLPGVRGLLAKELRPIILDTYSSAEGRELAAKVVLRQMPLRDHILDPFYLALATAIRTSAVDSRHSFDKEPLSPEMNELIRLAPKGLVAGFLRGQLKEEQIGGMLKLWLGLVLFNAGGEWRPVAEQLDPELRLSVGYGLGRRSLKLGRGGDAQVFFREIVERAKPGGLLHDLSKDELEHLKKP